MVIAGIALWFWFRSLGSKAATARARASSIGSSQGKCTAAPDRAQAQNYASLQKLRRTCCPDPYAPGPQLLHDEVAATLREQIFDGTLTPGSFLDEAALCERLSISRTPLREALKVLTAEGLLRHEPRRGLLRQRGDRA